MFLAALDRVDDIEVFISELGIELVKMRDCSIDGLDSMLIKDILTSEEDSRIAKRISECHQGNKSHIEVTLEERKILSSRLDLSDGDQCARDFFVCLQMNADAWPEVYSLFEFRLEHSTVCLSCSHRTSSESFQTFMEVTVPANNSNLNNYLEEVFNQSDLVTKRCEDGCKKVVQAQKQSQLVCGKDTEFLTIVLSRSTATNNINFNKIVSTNEVFIR